MNAHLQLHQLTEQTLALMLEYNEMHQLLVWLIDLCYTTSAPVADRCFRAIATVFASRCA